MTEIRRELPGIDVQFWKCWETQDRGVLHLHAILWACGVSEKRMRKVWQTVLGKVYDMESGYRFEWGTQQTLDAIGSRLDVAELIEDQGYDPADAIAEKVEADEGERLKFMRYGAKYCTKGGKRAVTINRLTGEIRENGGGYRTWSASARWGLRMKVIRAQQQSWAQKAAAATGGRQGDAGGGSSTGDGAAGALDPSSDFYAGDPLALVDQWVDALL